MALGMDIGGTPHMTFWHDFRQAVLGDINIQSDLSTLITDGGDPNLGHCIGNFISTEGDPINICPRTALGNMVKLLKTEGYEAKATIEIEFLLFRDSFEEARQKKYTDLVPVGASRLPAVYSLKNAYHAKVFMDKIIARLNWQGIAWEAWNDEGAPGQVELNLTPTDPVSTADNVVRVKQLLYETAVDMGLSLTFMPKTSSAYGSGMHIHHSLTANGEAVFHNSESANNRSEILTYWLGGIMASLPASVSFLCPSINSYRRMVDFTAPPTTLSWGEENKSAALRLITRSPSLTRIENRVPSSDVNPYLALAVILAGGLAGLKDQIVPPEEMSQLGWSIPERYPRLPNTISKAADALEADTLLGQYLGEDFIEYWINSRRAEWMQFQTESGDPYGSKTTQWEFNRYFELV